MATATILRRSTLLFAVVIAVLALPPASVYSQTADLTIVKDSKPDDDTPFPFFVVSPSNDTTFFTLQDPSDPDTTLLELTPGTYQIWETLPKFWALSVVVGTGEGINVANDSLIGTVKTLAAEDSVTITLINTKFGFDVIKTDSLIFDGGTPNVADGGDSLKYTIYVVETEGPIGNLAAASFELFDTPDPSTTLVAGSVEVMASFGSPNIILGNGVGHTQIWLESAVAVGDTTTIMFKAVVNDEFDTVSAFCNQATINGISTARNTPIIPSDDPDDPTSAEDETCIPAGEQNLPVELSSFEGTVEGSSVQLTWTTLSEANNAGFAVEMKETTREAFSEVGYVDGHGTTLEPQSYHFVVDDLGPGSYAFRLKQIDFDGAFQYSETVQATIGIPGSFYLSEAYPNPFNPSTTLRLGVGADQRVRVAVFDALGKQVRVLHDGIVKADNVKQVRFDASDLPSGLYFVRASGATFAATRTVMLMK